MNGGKCGGLMERAADPSPMQVRVAMVLIRRQWSAEEREWRRHYQEPISQRRREIARARGLRP